MDLFDHTPAAEKNLLPRDGQVYYLGQILESDRALRYFESLLREITWKPDEAVIFGKHVYTKRKVAWYADQAYSYTYSGVQKTALPWTPALLELKARVESASKQSFNACLLNLYHDGSEGMAWHSDGEQDLEKHGAIASLSLGASRKFSFKHIIAGTRIDMLLEPGSLLIMQGETQQNWLHRLPPSRRIHTPRINLTFRRMVSRIV